MQILFRHMPSLEVKRFATVSGAAPTQALDSKTAKLILWMKNQGAYDEHSAVSVGMSSAGRGMFASRPIRGGERMLEVPTKLMITSKSLQQEVVALLPSEATEWARVSLFILAEWNKRQSSPWESYIRMLPSPSELHHTVFWASAELECLKHSPVYRKTIQRDELLSREFSTVEKAISQCPHIFGGTASLESFKHAYSIVCSRSWQVKDLCSLGMVPYMDLFNHDWRSSAVLSNDPDKQCVLVIADRDYAAGEEVSISYGQVSNATLAVDYGFTLPYNPFDEAEVWMTVPRDDPLHNEKLDLLSQHNIHLVQHEEDGSMGRPFVIRDTNTTAGGIPAELRSFARVVSASSSKELSKFTPTSSGVFTWDPADHASERRALHELRSRIDSLIQRYVAADLTGDVHGVENDTRREMAQAVLNGEVCTLKAASNWLAERHNSLKASI